MRKKLNELENKINAAFKELQKLKKQCRKAPEIGGTVEIAGMEWTVLEKTEAGYLAITKEFISTSTKFDSNTNNWGASDLRNYLNTEFLKKIEEDLGEGILPEFERNLLSMDGQIEYGSCMDKVSLLTVDEYRKYRKYLPNTDKWWWTCTPWSTDERGWKYSVTVVSASGVISYDGFDYNYGVRPFCIFPSSIFESEEE